MTDKRSLEEIERSEKLFEKLATEEPPLEVLDDTAPSATSPTRAIVIHSGRNLFRYGLVAIMALMFAATIYVTMIAFQPEEEEPIPTEISLATQPATQIPSQPTDLPIPTTTPEILSSPTLRPTAAVDEISIALTNPISSPAPDGRIRVVGQPFTITGSSGRTEVTTYTVQPGDTLSRIASQYGLDLCTLVWSNPRSKVSPLMPGILLSVLPVDGVLYRVDKNISIAKVAEETKVDPYEIIEAPLNKLSGATPDTILVEGMKVVIPGGEGGDCNIWVIPVASNNGANVPYGGRTLKGCDYAVDNPGFPTVFPVGGNYKFTQAFSMGHTGVDLAARSGTPVFASGAGTVIYSSFSSVGYGNAVVIAHGTTFTLYGHLNDRLVSCGDRVGAGQQIGTVGNTGRSSGPHLHFEIRDTNFNPVNPVYTIPM